MKIMIHIGEMFHCIEMYEKNHIILAPYKIIEKKKTVRRKIEYRKIL